MSKLILLSIIIGSIVIPVRAARLKDPRQGFKKMLVRAAVFNFIYLLALIFLWGRF